MTDATRGFQHDSDVLTEQVDRQLALLRAARRPYPHESRIEGVLCGHWSLKRGRFALRRAWQNRR